MQSNYKGRIWKLCENIVSGIYEYCKYFQHYLDIYNLMVGDEGLEPPTSCV